jgi:transcription factor CP2-like protein
MLNDSTLSTILFRIEHLFDGQTSPSQKSLETNTQDLFHSSTSNDVLRDLSLTNDIVDDLDRYLINGDHLSDSSHTSSPSMPPSSVPPLTQQLSNQSSQFEFILNALTASSARINEETTTYLNQGQPYEIKFHVNNNSPSENLLPSIYRSILRICFWDKTLQSQERELMQKWFNEYQLSSLFDIDMNLTYGILSIIHSRQVPNAVEIVWDPSTTTSLFLRFKCTSTDFAQKRHGGEKGIPLRIQIDTYGNDVDDIKHLHSCCCKIQLFRLKGAQRKNKADQIKIDKLNSDQRRRYQTTLEYTILQPCNVSPLYTLNLLSLSYPPEDLSDVYTPSTITTDDLIIPKRDGIDIAKKRNRSIGFLSSSLPDMKYNCSELQKTEREKITKITVRSSNEEVLNWLNNNNFSSVSNRFQHYTGTDLLRLTINDIRRICNGDDSISIRLYNQLNETVIPPLKTLYIKTSNNDTYSAIYLHTLTRNELIEKIFQLIQQTQQDPYNLILELNKIKIKIDNDNVVKYSLPNGGQFYLKIFPYEFVLCLINNSIPDD